MKEKRLNKSGGAPSQMQASLLPHQKPVSNFLREYDIATLIGIAGCSKDFVQLYRAVDGLLKKEFEYIIISKPAVEVGKGIGFLPGLESEKLQPYERSFMDNLVKLVGKTTAMSIKNKIFFEHVGFQRGNTFRENAAIILSEIQNFTLHELITMITRVPESSKLFMNGDPDQIDIKDSGLKAFLEITKDVEGFGVMELDPDIHQMRSKRIVALVKAYQEYKKKINKF